VFREGVSFRVTAREARTEGSGSSSLLACTGSRTDQQTQVNRDTVAAGLPFAEATKKVADAWRELGQGEKSRYEDMAREDKER
jgi:hypothetical protein